MPAPRLVLVALAVATLFAATGCRGDDKGAATSTLPPLAVGEIEPAVRAVEASLGGPQQYTEINAIPGGVNVFVASTPGNERAWLWSGGRLQEPGAEAAQAHEPFGLDGVDLSAPPRLVADVEQRFPGASVVRVALVPVDGAISWALQSRSVKGGLLNLLYSPSGQLRSALPADDGSISSTPASTPTSAG